MTRVDRVSRAVARHKLRARPRFFARRENPSNRGCRVRAAHVSYFLRARMYLPAAAYARSRCARNRRRRRRTRAPDSPLRARIL